ncbi:mitochondrial inner membrane protease atp23 [Venturia nashicola]|uniref:Mitochondrial inner membrane protease ATP23 n=1 Tax=Venturia nashicola TaxID=86259 RepID=A0A4Z1P4M8_9PEZI|nr:mitochondrial inner membrane protease atp23 [Venturia nashicola]TLD36459.1 mitochondrial inner membrane protease atp23 [Venturia nashicola]
MPSSTVPSTKTLPLLSSDSIDTSVYTWSTFFKALSGQLSPAERNQYLAARDLAREESDVKRCEAHRDWLLQNSPTVTFLRQQIAQTGPTIEREQIRCKRCTTSQTGGFDSNYGILLCANHLPSRKLVEDTLAHELIHAYDHNRFTPSPTNLRHQACTEIRASLLSGECRFGREVLGRGQWKFTKQMQECVRRRAVLSLMNRPQIAESIKLKEGEEVGSTIWETERRKKAESIVDGVWESCASDTRPFDEVYR